MLASLGPLLLDAQRRKYAVGAFNVLTLEYALGIVKAAEAEKSPVILQISPSIIKLFGLKPILSPCLEIAKQSVVPVCVHLDHGKTREILMEAMEAGFTSVMFDNSSLPIEDNIRETNFIEALAHQKGISLEAEIGKVGKEEDEVSEGPTNLSLTSIDDVALFSQKTKLEALAVSIGSIHGVKNPTIELDINLLLQIRELVSVPLVLHGSSGVTDASILSAIEGGITKINVATRLKGRVAHALYAISKNPSDANLLNNQLVSETIRDAVFLEAVNRIHLFRTYIS